MPRFHDETSKLHASQMGERPATSTAPYVSLILPLTLRLPSVRIAKCSNCQMLESDKCWSLFRRRCRNRRRLSALPWLAVSDREAIHVFCAVRGRRTPDTQLSDGA